jgi:large subunit ribosomal protein L10
MKKENKVQIIDKIAAQIEEIPNFYITDIEGLNAEATSKLRRACYKNDIKLVVVKNTLFQKALEKRGIEGVDQIAAILKGSSAIMFSQKGNAPAKLIQEFGKNNGKPSLKGAFVESCTYIGAENLDVLANIKSREELIGDIIGLLQSPLKNVISALKSQGADKVAGIVKTLSEKEEK